MGHLIYWVSRLCIFEKRGIPKTGNLTAMQARQRRRSIVQQTLHRDL